MSSNFVADILLSSTESGDPRVNIGEQTDEEGFGADTAVWANGDGFLSVPNPPSSAGCAQAIVEPEGNTQRVVATRDNRYAAKAGTLVPGDRAIVSNSEAWIKLTQASDKIEIVSSDMTVKLDGAGAKVTVKKGSYSIELTDSGIVLAYAPLGTAVTSLTLGPAGVDIIGTLTVNHTLVIVP